MNDRIFGVPVWVFVFLSFFVGAAPVLANQQLTLNKIASAPKIDGEVNIEEWAGATAREDMLQVRPFEFSEPSQRTRWYFAIDEQTLYVAAIAFDSDPDQIVARVLRQGADIDDDDFTFGLNPNGVRYDGIYSNGNQLTDAWEGIWRGAAKKRSDGWSMEMAIPFNTLTFDPANTTWGLNFWRELPRNNERMAWSSRGGQINPTTSGEASGFIELNQGLGLDFTPSFSYSQTKDHEANTNSNDTTPSLDISYKLTPSLNGLITLNTDFAATEVDDREIGVQRFGVFFPERRTFFLTDFDIFQFGGITNSGGGAPMGSLTRANGLPFFSRRIGLAPSGATADIVAGSKLSGRIGALDLGVLVIRQDAYEFEEDDIIESVDASNLSVLRLSTGVLGESTIGAIFTDGDPGSNLDSSTYGIDFNYRNTKMPNNKILEGQFWLQKSDNENLDGKDLAFNAGLGLSAPEGLGIGAQYHQIQENFDPRLGFVNREGVHAVNAEVEWVKLFSGDSFLQSYEFGIDFKRWEFLESGELQEQDISWFPVLLISDSGDFARVIVKDIQETLLEGEDPLDELGIETPAGEYDATAAVLIFGTSSHRKFDFETRLERRDLYQGDLELFELELGWRPSKHFSSEVEFELKKYDFGDVQAITREISWQSEVAFNASWSLVNVVQFDNVSNSVGINSRLRYNPAAGQDLFLVIDHLANKLPDENRFESVQTSGVVKVSYTLRY